MTRAKRLIIAALQSHGLSSDCGRLADLIVDTLDEASFLTREALNPPLPTDSEIAGAVEEALRVDNAE